MSEFPENPEFDAQLDEILVRAADGPDYLPRVTGTDHKSASSLMQRLDALEELTGRACFLNELSSGRWFETQDRLKALEASVRDWEVAEALSAVYDRINALEGRVALCGGIPDAGDPRPVVTIGEGEGPTLKRFVAWLTDHYYIIHGDDHAAATNNQFNLGLYDVEDVELIGEYLSACARAEKNREGWSCQ